MSRGKSLIKSVERNGVFRTVSLLIQIAFIKFGLINKIRLTANTYYLRKKNSDIPVFRQIFMDGEYDINIDFEPSIIVDLGANIGLSAAFFHVRLPHSRIFALEPDTNNYNQLLKNVSSKKVKALNYAIWSKSESLQIVKNDNFDDWGIQVKSSLNEISKNSVKGITMDELIQSEGLPHIDILKIDIEGAEQEVFKDNTDWLNKVKMLIIELHDDFIPSSSNNFFKALSKLEKFDFSISGENIIIRNRSIIKPSNHFNN